MEPTGLVLSLYRKHYGVTPLTVSWDQGSLDVAAARTADGTAITVAVVNPTEQSTTVDLAFTGAQASGAVRQWTLSGASRRSYNAPGQPRQVDVVQETVASLDGGVTVPALSVVLYEVPVR
jgi:alpha-L-arabinofuranosidase